MMRASVFAVAIALTLSTSIARAQGDTRLAGFNPELRAEVLAVVDSARRAGIPPEPLLDLAREGRAKRVPPDAIVQAVRTRAAKLQQARDVLGRATDEEIQAAAGALGAGVSPTALSELRIRRPGRDLTTPLGLLEQMRLKGIPRDTAAKAMLVLTIANVADTELTEFWEIVQREIGIGMLPSAEIAARAGGIAEGINTLNSDSPRNAPPPTGNPPPPRPPQRP